MNKEITIYELLGLIKDGKAPRSILVDNESWFLVKRDKQIFYIDKLEYEFHCCQLRFEYYIENNKLNNKVEILDEENDEFEDIEEIGTTHAISPHIADKIDSLIRNQKKIIERLNND